MLNKIINTTFPHTLPTKSKRTENFQNHSMMLASILILKPVRDAARERTNPRPRGHTHMAPNLYDYKCHTQDFHKGSGDPMQVLLLASLD